MITRFAEEYMEYLYETIEHQNNVPVKIFTQTVSEYPHHWHEDVEILFILKGVVEINVEAQTTVLNEGEVFFINSDDLHVIKSIGNKSTKLLVLQFDMSYFIKYEAELSNMKFSIDYGKRGTPTRMAYNKLRNILANMMKSIVNKEQSIRMLLERNLLDVIIVLINNFRIASETDEVLVSQNRIVEIIKYIAANYEDKYLNIEKVSDYVHLNPQYLSRFFKSQMDISIIKFVNKLRMEKSLDALKYTDNNIMDIAIAYGFADTKAYYRVFKENMGMTPTEYRKRNRIEMTTPKFKNYLDVNGEDTLSKLFEYLDSESTEPSHNVHMDIVKSIDMGAKTNEYNSSITKLTTFGYATHGLRVDLIKQLKTIQEDVGFEYVRFHGIFSDLLLVYNLDAEGSHYFNFNHVDSLLDNILSCKLKPFFELGFIPKDLASTDKTIFWRKDHISPPKDIGKWIEMIRAFVKHIIARYGIDEILTWYFEFWNEPEINEGFFDGDVNDFYDFFKQTYLCIKSIDSRLKVGGFGNVSLAQDKKWIIEYGKLARRDNIVLDFYTFHIYNTIVDIYHDTEDYVKIIRDRDTYKKSMKIINVNARLGNADYFTQTIDETLALINSLNITKDEMYITEWNSNGDCRDLSHDTCFIASFVVKYAIENSTKVNGMGYWTVSDIFEEFRLKQPLFHGGFGLITYNGIKKASYHAFVFLSQLSNQMVYKSDNMIVTKNGDDYQILLYNYIHYNEIFSSYDYSQISTSKRYEIFEHNNTLKMMLKLKNLHGEFTVEKQRVNREVGSSFDAWVRMGSPEKLSKKAYESLESSSHPSFETYEILLDGHYEMKTVLEPHEIQFIHMIKKY